MEAVERNDATVAVKCGANTDESNERLMMRLGHDVGKYYACDEYVTTSCDILKATLRKAVDAALRNAKWKSAFASVFNGRRSYQLAQCTADTFGAVCDEILSAAVVEIERQSALNEWDVIVAMYAFVAYVALANYGGARGVVSWSTVGQLAGIRLARRFAAWFAARDYDWTDFVRRDADGGSPQAVTLRVRSRSEFWNEDAPRAYFGANVQLYNVDGASTTMATNELMRLMKLTINAQQPFYGAWMLPPDQMKQECVKMRYIACNDRVVAIRVFIHNDGVRDVLRDDVTNFIVVGDAPMPDARLEPYTLRFDVGAFRRELRPHLARTMLQAARVYGAASLMQKLDDAANDDYLNVLVEMLLTKLSTQEDMMVRSELARLLGVNNLWRTTPDSAMTDDEKEAIFPIRSSPFRLLNDCVSRIADDDDGRYDYALTFGRRATVFTL